MTTGEPPALIDDHLAKLTKVIEQLTQGDLDLTSLPESLDERIAAAIRQLALTLNASQSRAHELEALNRVMVDITRQPDLKTLLTSIATHAMEILNCDMGAIALYDPDLDALVREVVVGDSPLAQGSIVARGEGVTGRVLDTREPLIINNYPDWEGKLPIPPGAEEALALMGIPILLGDALLGVINVGSTQRHGRMFVEEDRDLATRFATQAAIVIEKAQFVAELANRQEELARRTQELEALNHGLLDISDQPDLHTLLTSIARHAIDLLGSMAGAVYLHRPDRDVIELVVIVGSAALEPGIELKRGEGLSGVVWETGKPQTVSNYHEWEGRTSAYDERSEVRAVIGVPIFRGDTFMGVLNAAFMDGSRQFGDDDIELLSRFANQAAVAIEKAQIVADLEARNRELDAFSHTAAHDLRAPLGTLTGYLYLLNETLDLDGSHEAQIMMDAMRAASQQMLQTIDSLLLLAHLREVESTIEPVDMKEVVESALRRYRLDLEDYGIQLDVVEPLPPVMGYGPLLEEVLANLVGNAIKYRNTGRSDPMIRIQGRPDGTLVRYEVADNGRGIDEDDQMRLFEMFARFDEGETEGFGLGLSIVQNIIRKFDGEVGVQSRLGEGSTFWFALPATDLAGD